MVTTNGSNSVINDDSSQQFKCIKYLKNNNVLFCGIHVVILCKYLTNLFQREKIWMLFMYDSTFLTKTTWGYKVCNVLT